MRSSYADKMRWFSEIDSKSALWDTTTVNITPVAHQ